MGGGGGGAGGQLPHYWTCLHLKMKERVMLATNVEELYQNFLGSDCTRTELSQSTKRPINFWGGGGGGGGGMPPQTP